MSTAATPSAKPATPGPISTKAQRRRVILASLVGTTIEFYDFYIYATAAGVVFPILFFTGNDDTAKLLASMATFAAAFVARPIGSVIFGHYGDRIGRKATLIGALLTMGIATFLIGVLPTYYGIGIWAPVLLTILRFCQGLGLGGEWSGAALLATEYAEEGKRARAAMWPQLGAPFGFILANGFMLLLTMALAFNSVTDKGNLDHPFMMWGWRVPFLCSVIMVVVGLWVRFKLEETPVFKKALDQDKKVASPLAQVFKLNWLQLIQGTFIMLATYVLFYLMTAWILPYATGSVALGNLGIGYTNFLVLQLLAVLLFAAMIPVSGIVADKFGRRRSQLWITSAILIFGLTFKIFVDPASVGQGPNVQIWKVLLFLAIGMTLMGLTFGSMSAILPELFPTNVRYTGSGIAYNMASILGAAITPFVAVALTANFGVWMVGVYLAFAAVLTLIALWFSPETKDRDLATI
ncbi:MFS transporter [Galactobacter caseinivorans]|uniref:MFS transporter n=1 Tax=Galactobacter caseinivorans TaxID=2676123 RepID=A0A496PJM5_9MICC|nr:MFS transporter [Galactobacter caseinivorans]RKW70679.1 MFS transporter [Galactobacter caseinivorans]